MVHPRRRPRTPDYNDGGVKFPRMHLRTFVLENVRIRKMKEHSQTSSLKWGVRVWAFVKEKTLFSLAK